MAELTGAALSFGDCKIDDSAAYLGGSALHFATFESAVESLLPPTSP